ncbi:MAG: hypothetical protein DI568_04460 [Sphingomonas sp.]|nr:MAG: hypothetical protein DI568_04460 [Sphingomonas sp.]
MRPVAEDDLTDYLVLQGWLPAASSLLWLLATLWLLVRASGSVPAGRHLAALQSLSAALLSATATPWLKSSGYWLDASDKLVATAALLSLTMAVLPSHIIGRMAACALAGLWMMVGAASLRHGTPLLPYMAAQSFLLGAAILLLPPRGRPRWRQAAVLILLLLAAMVGFHRDIPFA